MSAFSKNLEQIWSQLRSQKPGRANYLEEITVKGLRGIKELRVPLPFPVTVLAGPNGCGKSTVLFALASAYRTEGAKPFTPASLFPDFRPKKNEAGFSDEKPEIEIVFSYVANHERLQMKWGRGKGKWNRSFFGKKRGSQPKRDVYLRTLANLSNPSEVRSVLQMASKVYTPEVIDASNIAFAQRILSFRYVKLNLLKSGIRDLLFAERETEGEPAPPRYSEFHMSAGERAILRLSMSLSKISDSLILVDEIEAGLHPYVQQILMLELQRLALRNKLQIVVTSHSATILDTVPPEARVFLERSQDNVVRREPYRDIIQKSLYGRSQNILSFLCEDEEGEEFLRGVLDFLGPKIDLLHNDIEIGRDTSKDQFIVYLETLGRFKKLADYVFVLDGDGRDLIPQLAAKAQELGQSATVLALPGNDPPEVWAWSLLKEHAMQYGELLGMTEASLRKKIDDLDNMYASAADKPAAIAKNKLFTFASEGASRSTSALFRLLGKTEAERQTGNTFDFVNRIQDAIDRWRAG